MSLSSFDDFEFYMKINLFENALRSLDSVKIIDNDNFKEELARKYENLGDNLPLYRERILRDLI